MRSVESEEVRQDLVPVDGRAGLAPSAEPLRLSWTDPESLDELVVEAWGAAAFLPELLALGFVVRERSRGETGGPATGSEAVCVEGTGAGDRMGETCTGAAFARDPRPTLALRARRAS